ncbi:uncharacterized protein LOC133384115 [Rhineura floridana]|uniref:uncharacterized protein LOC133384115 n=1 Tax=Rhineura floridana TaxID=261503 RepID=UPI002AC807BC|nr:uncharacterized protein LOC133384115 [Rhineura floridana]
MLLPLLLALHLIMVIPGRSWSFWKEPPDSYSWYHSLQTVGERFEDHIKTIDLLLQKLDNWMEEHLGALDQLVSDHVMKLWEWLEEHSKDLNTWLNMYLWALQEFNDRYMKDSDYTLGKEILLHGTCWEADMWLEHPNITLYKWLEEDPMNFYKALEIQGNNVGNSLHIHIQHLEDHVKILHQLLDNYTTTATKWLDGYGTLKEASSQKYAWKFLNVGLQAQKLGRAHATALESKCLSVMKWLEEHVDALEQWLWDSINWQQKEKNILKALSNAFK